MSTSKKQIVINAVSLIWNERNLDGASQYFHDDMEYIAPRLEVKGKENYLGLVSQFMEIFTDTEIKVLNIMEQGNQVSSLFEMTATQTGPYGDFEATGNRMTFQLMAMHTFEGDKLRLEQEVFDELGMMLAMGGEVTQKSASTT